MIRSARHWTWGLPAGMALLLVVGCTDTTGPEPEPETPAPSTQSEALAATNLTFGQISGGGSHSCGRTMSNGTLYCWGYNSDGQLGNGTLNNKKRPVLVNTTLKFTWVSAGPYHTCAIATNSAAYCWGNNSYGQLGDGTFTERWSPKLVGGGLSWSQIEVGGGYSGFTCGITTSGKMYCWGYNGYGQLGIGSADYYSYSWPTPVSDIGVTFRQLSLGGYHACAVSTTNAAYCWGYADYGQTGNGGIFYEPTAVTGGLAFRQVSAGQYHTCGTTTGNKAYCWGYGYDGALGNGSTTNRFSPRPVSGGLSFTKLYAGSAHTCGRTPGNKAYCWGANYSGQLGDGTTTKRMAPVAVRGGLLFSQMGTHGDHTCAATVTVGVGYCWGANYYGQVGDATTTSPRLTPTRVAGAL